MSGTPSINPPVPDPAAVFASAQVDVPIKIDPYGDVTTTGELRAVFGLSEAELPDTMLTGKVYVREVEAALHDVDPKLPEEWEQRVKAKPKLKALVETFALYCIASKICDVLPLIAARTMTDSKASFQRFDSDLQAVIKAIRQRFALAVKALKDALTEDATAKMVMPVLFGSGKPSYDRVTGA